MNLELSPKVGAITVKRKKKWCTLKLNKSSSSSLSILEIPLDKELTANCLVETHTKLEELIRVRWLNISWADYCKNIALSDTSNKFGTHAHVGSLGTKTTLAKLKSKMAAIFQDGGQWMLNINVWKDWMTIRAQYLASNIPLASFSVIYQEEICKALKNPKWRTFFKMAATKWQIVLLTRIKW